MANYRIIDPKSFYRHDTYRHFTEDCKCSVSMTARVDVTTLVEYSHRTGSKFYINFLYLLTRVMNSREEYRMVYDWKQERLLCYDVINPNQYIFNVDTENITVAYSLYHTDYQHFYNGCLSDIEQAKHKLELGMDSESHPNWFDASYIPWCSYDALHCELPDGYLFFQPVINWGKYREEFGRLMMPVTVRMNHAIADGYLIAKVFNLLEKEITEFVKQS